MSSKLPIFAQTHPVDEVLETLALSAPVEETFRDLVGRVGHPSLHCLSLDDDTIDTTLPLAAVLPPIPRNDSSALSKDLMCLLKTGVDVGAHLEDVFCFLPPLTLETVHIRPPNKNEEGPTLEFDGPLSDVCLLSEIAMVGSSESC